MKTKVNKTSLSIRCNNFLNSKYSYLLLLLLFIIGIGNMIHYGIGGGEISNPWFDEGILSVNSNHGWVGWIELIISMIGSIFTVWSDILIIRFDKKFIFPLIIGTSFTIINALLVGWAFTAISYFIMMITGILSFFKWKNENEESKMNSNIWILILVGLVLYISLGLLLVNELNYLEGLNNFWNWSDIIGSGIVMSSYIILLRKSKYGFLGFVVTDLYYIVAYAIALYWTDAAMYLIYFLFIDSPAFLSWLESN